MFSFDSFVEIAWINTNAKCSITSVTIELNQLVGSCMRLITWSFTIRSNSSLTFDLSVAGTLLGGCGLDQVECGG